MAQILIIEDDLKTATAIREGLRMDGHDAVVAMTAEEGAALCRTRPFDAIGDDCTELRTSIGHLLAGTRQ